MTSGRVKSCSLERGGGVCVSTVADTEGFVGGAAADGRGAVCVQVDLVAVGSVDGVAACRDRLFRLSVVAVVGSG